MKDIKLRTAEGKKCNSVCPIKRYNLVDVFFFRRHVNYVEVVWVEMGFQFAVTCETKLQEENGLFLYRFRGHVGQTIDRELL